MTRLPELLDAQSDDAVPDAHQDTEIDELSKSVPKLIGVLPDVLRDTNDIRHRAALAEMVSGLVAQVDKVRPLVLVNYSVSVVQKFLLLISPQSQAQPLLGDESTRVGHVQNMAFARFMNRISV
jgi:nuclear pore complex protein Nup98-Nup96